MELKDDNSKYLPYSEIIDLAKAAGVAFGKGYPYNRLRYYTKIGLLPHAKRKSFGGSPEGCYPSWVVDKLVEIDAEIKIGRSIQAIIREQKERNLSSTLGRQVEVIEPKKDVYVPSEKPGFSIIPALRFTSLLLFVIGISGLIAYNLPPINSQINRSNGEARSTSENRQSNILNSLGQVLARTTSPFLSINVDTNISGLLTASGGIETDGADVDLGIGELTASNVLYSLTGTSSLEVGTGQTPTIDISSTYPGQTSITTLGTIAAGTWNGTALTNAFVSDTLTIDGTGSVTWTALNTFPAACAPTDFVRAVGTLLTCAADSGGTGTLQDAYDNGNAILTTDARNILFSLGDTTTDSDFIVDLLGTGNIFEIRDGGTPFFTLANGQTITTSGTSTLDVNGNLSVGDTNIAFDGATTTFTTTGDFTLASAGTTTFGASGANEVVLTSTSFSPTTSEGNALGSTTNEWEALYLGDDNGIFFGLDQDFSLTYDEATDNRLELTFPTLSTSLYINGLPGGASASGLVDIDADGNTDQASALNVSMAGDVNGTTQYGIYVEITDSSTEGVGPSTSELYGLYASSADATGDLYLFASTENVYGVYGTGSNTSVEGGLGIDRNTYGGYFTASGVGDGTTTSYGVYGDATGSDTNWALYAANGDVGVENDLDVTGHVAFGSSAGVDADQVVTVRESNSTDFVNFDGLDIDVTGTGATQAIRGINLAARYSGTSGISSLAGLNARAHYSSTSGTATISSLAAITADVSTAGATAGSITASYGLNVTAAQIGAIVPTSTYGVNIANQGAAGPGINYGLYIENQTGPAASDYGIWIEDADTASIFLSSTDGDEASGIIFGFDTNLYRGAANTLQTDDALNVGGSLEIFGGFFGETLVFDEAASDVNIIAAEGNLLIYSVDWDNDDAGGAVFRWDVNGLAGLGGTNIMRLNEDGDLWIGEDSATDDDTLGFDQNGSEYLRWDDAPGEFDLSNDLNIAGNFTLNSTGYISVAGTSAADDDFIYFDSGTLESISWDESDGEFDFSQEIHVTGTGQSDIGGDLDIADQLAVGGNAIIVAGWINYTTADLDGSTCSFGICTGYISIPRIVTADPATYGSAYYGRVDVDTITLTNAATYRVVESAVSGGGAITNSYGIYLDDRTVATNDYGIYVAGADTYAIWVDNDPVRFDGLVNAGLSATASTTAVCSSLALATAPTAGVAYELRDCSGAPAADYMEMYSTEEEVETADIVTTGSNYVTTNDGDRLVKLSKSSKPYQGNIIGIVSNPDDATDFNSIGYNIKEEDNPTPVALNGRVKVKISVENGSIRPGDALTTSSIPGVAMKATRSGAIVGKALESFDGEGVGSIIVFVSVGWYIEPIGESLAPPLALGSLPINLNEFGSIQIDGNLVVTGDINLTGNLTLDGTVTASEVATKSLKILGSDEPTAGNSSIKSGKLSVKVNASSLTSGSKVFITPTTLTGGQALSVTDKKPGDYFTVEIETAHSKYIHFDWWIVN